MYKVELKKDKTIICNTNNINYVIDYLDYIFIENICISDILVNDEEYNIRSMRDYFKLRNELVKERLMISTKYEK